MWTLLKTDRTRTVIRTGVTSRETARHLCTLDARARTTRQRAAHIRDPNVVGSLSVARAALLFFNSRTKDGNVNVFVESCREEKSMALRLLTARKPFK